MIKWKFIGQKVACVYLLIHIKILDMKNFHHFTDFNATYSVISVLWMEFVRFIKFLEGFVKRQMVLKIHLFVKNKNK